jgi:predicted ribosome quality control (RQC) complex YloA/Tae2 family protein
VFAAIEELLRTRFRERRTARARQRLRQHVQRELARTEKALLEIRQYISGANKATLLRYKADLLLSTPDVHLSGSDRVVLTGWSGEDVVITLDEHLTLAENATQYYQRARRAEAAARMAAERAPKLEVRCTELQRMQEIVTEELSYSELQELMKKEHLDDATERGTHQSQKQSVSKYREFDLSEGWTLFVGRSAQNNDELTMKFAKQKDTWLHARGVSGSHAVLRSAQSTKPTKNILEKAAAIVAYYSKARNATYTPVVYTQRNNVRKPKGSAVGAVVLDREETIMIQPGLPADYKSLDD